MLYLILLSVLLGAAGQVLVKFGAVNLNFNNENFFNIFLSILTNIPVMSGIIVYGISFLIWIKVLSKVELSYAYPMVSLGYVLIIIFSYFIFKENVTITRIFGVVIIIIGVIIVSKS
jgi:multidrug transporter EmrE-like cation transporter